MTYDEARRVYLEHEPLIAERKRLTDALAACEPGAFPGSSAYREESAAIAALKAFDTAHPMILPAILAMRQPGPLGQAMLEGRD